MERYATFKDQKTHIVKMSVFPKLICRFSAIPIIDSLGGKLIWKCTRPRRVKQFWKEEKRGLTIADFKAY